MPQSRYPTCLECRRRFPQSRGLCGTCYGRALRAVQCGETTWAALEAEGKALPAAPRGHGWRRWRVAR
jgi:hypothetical protein